MKRLLPLLLLTLPLHAATIETVAGNGKAGYDGDGGAATSATLNQPFGVIIGPEKDIWFTDTNNHVIRRISHHTAEITTVVGNGQKGYSGDGGPAAEVTCNEPYELRFDKAGNLYWVERLNHVVRKMDKATGKVSTIAGNGKAGFSGDGGPADKAQMHQPHSIQFDKDYANLLICDISNNRIRAVDMKTGTISTWCGNGKKDATPDGAKVGPEVPLKGPRALDIAPNGDLWLALREGNAVYRIDSKSLRLEHVAGTGKQGFTGNGGPAKEATLSGPKGVAISSDGKMIYLADTESHTVRAINLNHSPATLDLIAGDGKKGDGPDQPDPLKCRMARLHGIGIDPENGDLYIGDSETHKVRVVRFGK